MGRKLGKLWPLLGEGSWVPSKTMWPWLRPTCMPSFMLIHPTVWPRYINITDWTDRQRSDSKGRTVLQMVAQKLHQLTTLKHIQPQQYLLWHQAVPAKQIRWSHHLIIVTSVNKHLHGLKSDIPMCCPTAWASRRWDRWRWDFIMSTQWRSERALLSTDRRPGPYPGIGGCQSPATLHCQHCTLK